MPRVAEARDEVMNLGGHVLETKEHERHGVKVGLVTGYIATWDLDEGLDRFIRGAFAKAIARHVARPTPKFPEGRPVRFKNQHRDLVGGWPIDKVTEDAKGLLGRDGEINLEKQIGQELYSDIDAGFISDLSIGFGALEYSFEDEGMVRLIQESELWEGSAVDEPMNRAATIASNKAARAHFRDLPISAKEVAWDGYEGTDRKAFLAGEGMAFAQLDGKTLSVCQPRLIEIADLLMQEKTPNLHHVTAVEGYLAKAGLPSPFPAELRGFYRVDDVRKLTQRELESALHASGNFSKGAAAWLVEGLQAKLRDDESESLGDAELIEEILGHLRGSRDSIQSV